MNDTTLLSPGATGRGEKHPAYGQAGRAGGPAGGLTPAEMHLAELLARSGVYQRKRRDCAI